MRLHRIPYGNDWVYLLSQIRGKGLCCQEWIFLEKEFLTKGVSSRKVELEEVIEPSLHEMASSAAP